MSEMMSLLMVAVPYLFWPGGILYMLAAVVGILAAVKIM